MTPAFYMARLRRFCAIRSRYGGELSPAGVRGLDLCIKTTILDLQDAGCAEEAGDVLFQLALSLAAQEADNER